MQNAVATIERFDDPDTTPDAAAIEVLKARGLKIAEHHPADYIAAGRVEVVVRDYLDRHPGVDLESLAARSSVPARTIYRILRNDHPFWNSKIGAWSLNATVLRLDTVDRLFCAMNCVGLFHVGADDGGFADVYFHPSIIDVVEIDDDEVVGAAWRDEVDLPVAA
jgi:hypothetical protein